MKKTVFTLLSAPTAAALVACGDDSTTATTEPATPAGKYADVNGVRLSYEVHGEANGPVLPHEARKPQT
ncbi:hypothetical protein APR12_001651 [Nocardia amikacinitolerans]|uniref:hypothetical protein n=1 Tax=Nocardia amikacinitolerans TaxID=756689 RepID=UPI0008318AD9|nr:hypothetical protein [Nocardia amikacinitolerans]MCP2316314.1 hypothetical protein [Nocardia amikacinitolerans]